MGSGGAAGSQTGSSGPAGRSGGSAEPPAPAQTSDERLAALDRRLNESLGAFDAALRKEQERIAQERDAYRTAETESGGESGSGQDGRDEEGSGSATTEGPLTAGTAGGSGGGDSSRPGDLKSDRQQSGSVSAGGGNGSGAAAREIPDGSDDDIVARRLRKAAEQETDPELKEKLWKEYIEYKKNVQGK